MNIPNEVMRIFINEAESTSYGKVSLGIIRRGRHEHYEIDKHITITKDGEVCPAHAELGLLDQKEKTTEV